MTFYGVALPASANGKLTDLPTDSSLVLESKEEVLKICKLHKGGRFKAFQSRQEAEAFAKEEAAAAAAAVTEEQPPGGGDVTDALDLTENVTAPQQLIGEGCAFPGLTPQELKGLKEAIQKGDINAIDGLVGSNPRYLVTTCDTPSVLHSGTRSNALHFAAASGSIRTVEKVLDKIQDPSLMQRMYPAERAESRVKRQEHLFDLYLNMPNKGHNDTPLHQASKSGHLDIVRLLVSFSSCDTEQKNRDGKTPAEVACTRTAGQVDQDVKKEIEKALSGQVYIPVIRDVDLVVPGFIGEPWSPSAARVSDSVDSSFNFNLALNSPRPKSSFIPSSPRDHSEFQSGGNGCRSPLLLAPVVSTDTGSSPLRSPLTVRALFGPLSPGDAKQIRKEWNTSLNKAEKLADPLKGIEKRGRELAKKYVSNLFEYWDFLDAYCDLTKPDGLQLLENHLFDVALKIDRDEQRERQREVDDLDYQLNNSTTADAALSPVSQLAKELDDFHVSSPPLITTIDNIGGDDNGNSIIRISDEEEETELVADSFASLSSSSSSSYETAEEGAKIYMCGPQPSKIDNQVFDILKNVDIDDQKYPRLGDWRSMVFSAPKDTREGWGNVKVKRRQLINVAKFNLDQA